MTARYNELEPRYALAGRCDGVTVVLTSWQELLIQTPCGLALFYAYWRRASWRLPLEIVFNCWSVAGVLYFYGSEPALGFPHVHAPFTGGAKAVAGVDVARPPLVFDAESATTFESLYKFWLGFVIFPGLWAVVGVILTVRAARTIAHHVDMSTHQERTLQLPSPLKQDDALQGTAVTAGRSRGRSRSRPRGGKKTA